MSYDRSVIIILPEADADAANAWVRANVPGETGDTWTEQLSPTGAAPATHRWCCWRVTPALAQVLQNRVDALVARGWILSRVNLSNETGKSIAQVLSDAGLQRIERPVT